MLSKIAAGSSTRAPMSTRFDNVGMFISRQIFSIQEEPERPTDTTHQRQVYVSPRTVIS